MTRHQKIYWAGFCVVMALPQVSGAHGMRCDMPAPIRSALIIDPMRRNATTKWPFFTGA
jgi:hypothetical protein